MGKDADDKRLIDREQRRPKRQLDDEDDCGESIVIGTFVICAGSAFFIFVAAATIIVTDLILGRSLSHDQTKLIGLAAGFVGSSLIAAPLASPMNEMEFGKDRRHK